MNKHGAAMVLLEFLLGIAIARTAGAQASPRPEFTVASIKPSTALGKPSTAPGTANSPGRPEVGNSNGRGHAKDATLKMIMATAWQVPVFQISGGPGWVDSERFDVEARAEDPKTGYIPLRLMMQSLLEDRFRLRVHRESRVSAVYFLVTTRGGVKMNLSADQTSPDETRPPSSPFDGPLRGGALIGPGMLIGNAAPVSLLAKVLTPELERPILDKTNLNGRYDIRLKWMPQLQPRGVAGAPSTAANAADLPGLFTALREQLGLELKADRAPVEFLIIDSAEKPSPN
jgi:uncharacterized protein (TIGR03435 family)